jgi:hypothetical protein
MALARKNRLGRYKKEKVDGELEKVFIFFDEGFLKMFQEKHKTKLTAFPFGRYARKTKSDRTDTCIYSVIDAIL